MQSDELEPQLHDFPLDEPVSIDGESVYLRVHQDGAELGAHFLESVTERQLQDALQLGFQSALEFDAGWALSDDGASLMLTQWLPGVRDWPEVSDPLERLLNQVELLRTLVTITGTRPEQGASRDERRFRSKLNKGE
jgi:hypothetical protein